MCLAVFAFKVIDDVPVFVAANREEEYRRPTAPPEKRGDGPAVLCGLDLRAGGTWLGVSAFGVVVGVTNRNTSIAMPAARSRGLLCRDLLSLPSAEAVAEQAGRELAGGSYAACNVFCLDQNQAYVVHWGETLDVASVSPGIHVLTSGDVDDQEDARLARAYRFLADKPPVGLSQWIERSSTLCRLHEDGGPAICLHGREGGTVSSTILAVPQARAQALYLHSNGPPCTSDYDDYSEILRRDVLGSVAEERK